MGTCSTINPEGHTMIDDARYPEPYRAHSGEMRRHTICSGCGNVGNRPAEEVRFENRDGRTFIYKAGTDWPVGYIVRTGYMARVGRVIGQAYSLRILAPGLVVDEPVRNIEAGKQRAIEILTA